MHTATIVLGELTFTVPALNIDQLERVTDVLLGPPTKAAFGILKIALERAEPKPDVETLAPRRDQISAVVNEILTLSGFEPAKNDKNDPKKKKDHHHPNEPAPTPGAES